jgi:DNA-binding Xre family transcriptional regulator
MIRIKLREILDERKLSQSKLSRISDVSLNTIQLLCRDPYRDPFLSTIERLAKALNLRMCDLYEIEDDQ